MFSSTAILICPNCAGKLESNTNPAGLECAACTTTYPEIEGITILDPMPGYYVAKMLFAYQQHISAQQKLIARIGEKMSNNDIIKHSLHSLLEATRHNLSLFLNLETSLEQHTKSKNLLNVFQSRPHTSYATALNYVYRDWSGAPESEYEVDQIVKFINANFETRGKVLFLGAGTGRLALELADRSDEIWCIDSSFTMAYLYHHVLRNNFSFYRIQSKNLLETRDRITFVTTGATAQPQLQRVATSKAHYVIGDAIQSPFTSASFDCVFSIYFSDVVHPAKLLAEVKRVLRPGGTFIHFGPLEFHFEEVEEMWSFEEFIEMLRIEGFIIKHKNSITFDNPEAIKYLGNKIYNNQFVVAQLNESSYEDHDGDLLHIPLSLAGPVEFKTTGFVGTSETTDLIFSNGFILKNVSSLMEVIRLIDGKRSLTDIFAILENDFEVSEAVKSQSHSVITTLYNKKLVRKSGEAK